VSPLFCVMQHISFQRADMTAHSKGAWHDRKQIPPPVTLAAVKANGRAP
jgi:hypothetical protein